jgi:hypothetical protein
MIVEWQIVTILNCSPLRPVIHTTQMITMVLGGRWSVVGGVVINKVYPSSCSWSIELMNLNQSVYQSFIASVQPVELSLMEGSTNDRVLFEIKFSNRLLHGS